MAPLVPVEIGPSVPPRDVAEAPLTTRRRVGGRARASSRLILGADTASGSMATLMETRCVESSMLWCADDPGSDRRPSVARDRLHGYAQRLSVAGTPSAGGAAQRSAERSSVRLPRPPQRFCEDDMARWPGSMHLAVGCRRIGNDLAGAVELSVVRDRLAQPSRNPASDAGRIAILGLNLVLDLIQWLRDIEAGRSSIGPCQCPGGAAGRA